MLNERIQLLCRSSRIEQQKWRIERAKEDMPLCDDPRRSGLKPHQVSFRLSDGDIHEDC